MHGQGIVAITMISMSFQSSLTPVCACAGSHLGRYNTEKGCPELSAGQYWSNAKRRCHWCRQSLLLLSTRESPNRSDREAGSSMMEQKCRLLHYTWIREALTLTPHQSNSGWEHTAPCNCYSYGQLPSKPSLIKCKDSGLCTTSKLAYQLTNFFLTDGSRDQHPEQGWEMVLKATAVAFVGIQILEKKRAGDAGPPKAVSCADIGQSIMCSQCCLCLMMDMYNNLLRTNPSFL